MDSSEYSDERAPVLVARRPQFPAPLTPCIGRDAELAQLRTQLDDPTCRLITVCGGGGIGKTRLVLELGRILARDGAAASYAGDGIAFVSLASLTPRPGLDELLATTIAEALGFTFGGPDPPDVQLRRYLRERSLLLVLDNLEQIPAAVPHIAMLLQETQGVKILATSRERLKLRGERVFVLQPLAYPAHAEAAAGDAYSAVQLFVDTARTVTPELVLDAGTQAALVRICRLVEGLPLGIELAASWTRVLSCDEIAEQLARNLDVLDSTMQDLPERHHSLRAVFDASWTLLDPSEQQMLRRLSVIRGSFGREAAAVVTGATLPMLLSLVDKSLIRRLSHSGTADVRFGVPEILRQFAAEQLLRCRRNRIDYCALCRLHPRPCCQASAAAARLRTASSAYDHGR